MFYFFCVLNADSVLEYWGWFKYRYPQINKPNFAKAKEAAIECLDACPTDTIRRFINRSWRFIDAYRKGLKCEAAAWAVKQQKGHRKVSERAMVALERNQNYPNFF